MPSTTSGVAWKWCDVRDWNTHFISRSPTLSGVIRSSVLCRWLAYVPE